MNLELLVGELKQLERPIGQNARASLLADLRAYPVPDIDYRRPTDPNYWRKYRVFFHSLQDTLYANCVVTANFPKEYMKTVQACFVKDLDFYLKHFPKDETEMRRLFGLVFQVGTSAYWENDGELVTELHRMYWALDKQVIRPWVEQEEKLK